MAVLDALRGYVQLATGLTEVTVTRAREAASALVAQGMEVAQGVDLGKITGAASKDSAAAAANQVQEMADDLIETSKQNREMLVGLVRTEVDRAAGRMGFVREEELAAVRRHVSRLEEQVAELRAQRVAAPTTDAPASSPTSPGVGAGEAVSKSGKKKKKVVASGDAASGSDVAPGDAS